MMNKTGPRLSPEKNHADELGRPTDLYIYNLDTVPPITSYGIMWTLKSLPLQMAERLRRAQPVSVANHVKARQSLIERAVT